MSCPRYCCQCCYNRDDDKYPHFRYTSPVERSPAPEIPIGKIFHFPQQQTEFALHPQVTEKVITRQPTSIQSRSSFTPQPISIQSRRSSFTPQPISIQSRRSSFIPQPTSIQSRRFPFFPKPTSTQSRRSPCLPQPTSTQRRFSITAEKNQLPIIHISQHVDPSTATDYDSIPILSSDTCTSTKVQKHGSTETPSPRLFFSTYYDFQRSLLSVHLCRAENLPAGSKEDTRNAFVIMYLDPNKKKLFQAKIVPNSLNPLFDQVFEFKELMPDEVRQQKLVFWMYDSTKACKDSFMGTVVVPLGEADLLGVITSKTIDKRGKDLPGHTKGDLLLSLTYNLELKVLKGIVRQATNLQKQDVAGLAAAIDPYVKVYLLHRGKRHSKWKTTVRKNTLTPVFNETFSFDISNMEASDISLEIVVMDHDRFTTNDLVGVVTIGDNTEQESGKIHWSQVVSSPQQAISYWHSIFAASGSRGIRRNGSIKERRGSLNVNRYKHV